MTPQQAAAAGRDGFRQRFGTGPDGVWLAPGRVNLIGEHTDYQQGLCLPIAIERHTAVAARRRQDGRVRAWSGVLAAAAEADLRSLAPRPGPNWFNYVAGVLAGLGIPRGVDLFVFGDLPLGAGLSSSAALEMAVAVALNDLFALSRTPEQLAAVGQRAENLFAGVNSGIMDQMASALGQARKALLLDTRIPTVSAVPFVPEDAGLALVVIDTRAAHQVSGGGYQARFEEARAAAAALGVPALRDAREAEVERLGDPLLRRRARHIVTENARVVEVVAAAGRGDWPAVGQAFFASHRSLAMDYEVSHPALDLVVSVAREVPGVLGARLTGAGFGGSAIALLRTEAEAELIARLRAQYARRGWAPFTCAAVQAAAGARRVEGGGTPG